MPDLLVALAPRLGRSYLGLVGATTRFRRENAAAVERARGPGGTVVWACWHNRLLGPLLPHRDQGVGVVISQSRDGELLSRVVEGFGYAALRGSSSRGGSQALRGVLRHLKGGRDVALTPDGPRGPRYRVAPGVGFLARRTGRPVVPLGVAMSRKAVFRSWDRFQLPLPFGTVLLEYGEPLRFGPDEPPEAVAEAIRAALVAVTERAEARLGVSSP